MPQRGKEVNMFRATYAGHIYHADKASEAWASVVEAHGHEGACALTVRIEFRTQCGVWVPETATHCPECRGQC